MGQDDYKDARMACELARHMLAGHDFSALLRAVEHSHALGPLMDPTLYRAKHEAMDQDAQVFRGALAFLRAWPGDKP